MTLTVRQATADDFRAVAGREPPKCWFGAAAEDADGRVVAIGKLEWAWVVVCGHPELLCWASFDRLGEISAVAIQRRVLAVLAELRAAGEPAVYAYCNRVLPTAERWLRRLGFRPRLDLEAHPQFGHVWQCDLTSN